MSVAEYEWAQEICLAWGGNDPGALLEQLMAHERCAAFGPVHHYLVGAALMACSRDVLGEQSLESALDELAGRAYCVPGAACAKWGVCGAAASCGMAFAVLAGNAPLRPEGWSEGQLMVADILQQIAHAGAPRCCKRDSRIAVRAAVPWFNKCLGTTLVVADENPRCAVASQNKACLGDACPYHLNA